MRITLAQYVGGRTFTVAVISLRAEAERRASEQDASSARTLDQK